MLKEFLLAEYLGGGGGGGSKTVTLGVTEVTSYIQAANIDFLNDNYIMYANVSNNDVYFDTTQTSPTIIYAKHPTSEGRFCRFSVSHKSQFLRSSRSQVTSSTNPHQFGDGNFKFLPGIEYNFMIFSEEAILQDENLQRLFRD